MNMNDQQTATPYPEKGFFRQLAWHMRNDEENVSLAESSPLMFMHLGLVTLLFFGFSWVAAGIAFLLYVVRVFALTGGYHRYFSHNSFKTGRISQFVLAFIGGTSAQLGPLWWAAHHRHHHQHSDTELDIHSPVRRGFLWSHVGWLLCRKYATTELKRIPDFARYPELRFLDRFHAIPPLMLLAGLYLLGRYLDIHHPGLGTSGGQLVAWGFFLSTVLVYHATFCINSVTHMVGTRRFKTNDESRNSMVLALITMGEGWHNNHHRYPVSTRQGFYWWEIDMTYYILKVLSWMGIVWDLRPPSEQVYREAEELAAAEAAVPAN